MNCIIIADDLTGACDSALQFRKRGARTLVHVRWNIRPQHWGEVDAFSTDSRDLAVCEADARICAVARQTVEASGPPTLVFKKIDSLLRGNPGLEIRTTLEAFGCDIGIIAPGFPAMGRIVLNGFLHFHGDPEWKPLDVPQLLRCQGLEECHHVSPELIERTLHGGAKYISVDSVSSEDLHVIVTEAMRDGRRVLWAGSAGLASGLASASFPEPGHRIPRLRGTRPILFCIGSRHSVTIAQLQALRRDRATSTLNADATSRAGIAAAFASGKHVIVQIDTEQTEMQVVHELFSSVAGIIEAVVISGGDTVSLFCRATGCETIEIEDQILDGVPWGTLRGGLLDSLTVATKSGAFGAPDALVKVTDFFTCPGN